MESRRESIGRILRSRAFLFLVVAMVLIAVIAAATGGGDRDDGDGLRARASSSVEVARTDEDVAFSSSGSLGDIESCSWDFGDGQAAEGAEVSHAFESGGWYNVTLTVEDAKGRNATDVVTVGVQPEDVHNTRDLGRQRDLRPLWQHGYGLLGDVGPHIHAPTSTLEYDVVQAFGTFQVYVEVWVYEGEVYSTELLHSEAMTMTGGDLHFTYTVEPGDLPPEAATNYTRVHVSTMIDQGRWTSSEIRVDVEFPFP
jgi:PKD repeat protein